MWYPGSDCGGFDAVMEWIIATSVAAMFGIFGWCVYLMTTLYRMLTN